MQYGTCVQPNPTLLASSSRRPTLPSCNSSPPVAGGPSSKPTGSGNSPKVFRSRRACLNAPGWLGGHTCTKGQLFDSVTRGLQ
jgi:hypothetical protein